MAIANINEFVAAMVGGEYRETIMTSLRNNHRAFVKMSTLNVNYRMTDLVQCMNEKCNKLIIIYVEFYYYIVYFFY